MLTFSFPIDGLTDDVEDIFDADAFTVQGSGPGRLEQQVLGKKSLLVNNEKNMSAHFKCRSLF
jgi:hypothetical protein